MCRATLNVYVCSALLHGHLERNSRELVNGVDKGCWEEEPQLKGICHHHDWGEADWGVGGRHHTESRRRAEGTPPLLVLRAAQKFVHHTGLQAINCHTPTRSGWCFALAKRHQSLLLHIYVHPRVGLPFHRLCLPSPDAYTEGLLLCRGQGPRELDGGRRNAYARQGSHAGWPCCYRALRTPRKHGAEEEGGAGHRLRVHGYELRVWGCIGLDDVGGGGGGKGGVVRDVGEAGPAGGAGVGEGLVVHLPIPTAAAPLACFISLTLVALGGGYTITVIPPRTGRRRRSAVLRKTGTVASGFAGGGHSRHGHRIALPPYHLVTLQGTLMGVAEHRGASEQQQGPLPTLRSGPRALRTSP
eukprot:Sspe_Gene.28227::Locus_12665_Transcript_1_1_Confidence_1.000_Length_2386::g.28227::m.28227